MPEIRNSYDLREFFGELLFMESFPAVAKYGGNLLGVDGIIRDYEPLEIIGGAAIYITSRWLSICLQDRIEVRRFETLEKRLKE